MGATQTILLSFSPTRGSIVTIYIFNHFFHHFLMYICNLKLKFQEYLQIQTRSTSLNLRLNGVGIQPSVSLSLEGTSFDFGYSLAGERLEKIIHVIKLFLLLSQNFMRLYFDRCKITRNYRLSIKYLLTA